MHLEPIHLLTIAGMALVTLATRVGGYWLVRRTVLAPRVAAALRGVPPAILVSLVAPATLAAGWPETAAVVVVVVVAARAPGLLAIIAGVACVVALRRIGA